MFKPKSNLLYKSKFRINFEDSIFYDVIVKGKGTFDEEMMTKWSININYFCLLTKSKRNKTLNLLINILKIHI